MKSPLLLALLAALPLPTLAEVTHQYLFIGHPRSDGSGQVVQREVERIDYAAYDMLLLGGDYTLSSTGSAATVAYLDAIFDLASPDTLASLGNHDTANVSLFTSITGRPRFYAHEKNGITFIVLDTTNDSQNILGAELQLIEDTIDAMPADSHLVLVHHHIVWLTDNVIGDPHYGDNDFIASSSSSLAGKNFFTAVYPLLLEARAKGVSVLCLAGDRTGSLTEEYFIDHTTAEGVHFVAAGLKDILPSNLRTVVVLEQDVPTGTLTHTFKHLTDLPSIPDEPLVINELHYNPSPAQGNDTSYIELLNRGNTPYDLSGATFSSGVGFTFPANTIIAPGEFIIVAAVPSYFTEPGIRVFDYAGSDKPTTGAPIWLRRSNRLEIDYVDYDITAPWPTAPDNNGSSLMLIDPRTDNNLASSWAASDQPAGTPGHPNIIPPSLHQLLLTPGLATTDWTGTITDATYRLDYLSATAPPTWSPATTPTPATGPTLQLTDSTAPSQRLYRLTRLFP